MQPVHAAAVSRGPLGVSFVVQCSYYMQNVRCILYMQNVRCIL